jgi:site-specific recombinase XerD
MSGHLIPHLQAFFQTYLRQQRALSPHTIKSYRDTFKLLVTYLQSHRRRSPLTVADLDAKTILAFLQHLEDDDQGRGNSAHTRNQRLAAIHAFFKYLSLQSPGLQHQADRVAAIPRKRVVPRTMESLNRAELETLLAQPRTDTPDGVRDLALLTFLYNTGARASEVAQAHLSQFNFPNRTVTLFGKGQKQRLTPLWPSTVRLLILYKDQYRRKPKPGYQDFFFIDQRGLSFTRFGIRAIMKRHLCAAAKKCPSLATKRLSTHNMRHTTAVHLLESRVDPNVIKAWLGHASISSTSRYLDTDLNHKRRILEKFGPPDYVAGSLEPKPNDAPDKFLDWLDEL